MEFNGKNNSRCLLHKNKERDNLTYRKSFLQCMKKFKNSYSDNGRGSAETRQAILFLLREGNTETITIFIHSQIYSFIHFIHSQILLTNISISHIDTFNSTPEWVNYTKFMLFSFSNIWHSRYLIFNNSAKELLS